MTSVLKNRLKEMVRQYLRDNPKTGPSYTFGTVIFLNDGTSGTLDDGSVVVLDNNGDEVRAFPKYPVTIGQNVVLVNDGQGSISAVPIVTKVEPGTLIHPPYFTGGKVRTATIHTFVGSGTGVLPLPPARYSTVDFQDQGDNNVYRLSFPDLPGSQLACHVGPFSSISGVSISFLGIRPQGVVLSADGSYAAVAFYDGTPGDQGNLAAYRLRLYYIGQKMQSSSPNALYSTSTYNIWPIKATLVNEYSGQSNNLVSLQSGSGQWISYNEVNVPVDMFITSDHQLWWLEFYNMEFFTTGPTPLGPLPLNLFAPPTGTVVFSSLCTLYYVKQLQPNNIGAAIGAGGFTFSVILGVSQPGPATGNYIQYSPNSLMDVRSDLSVLRVGGIFSLSGNVPYTFLYFGVADKMLNPQWVTSAGGWLTLNQSPTPLFTGPTFPYTETIRAGPKLYGQNFSCYFYSTTSLSQTTVINVRGGKVPAAYQYLQTDSTSAAVDGLVLLKSSSLGVSMTFDVFTTPQWINNFLLAQVIIKPNVPTVIKLGATPQPFTPKYTAPDIFNVASVGFATFSSFPPIVTFTAS